MTLNEAIAELTRLRDKLGGEIPLLITDQEGVSEVEEFETGFVDAVFILRGEQLWNSTTPEPVLQELRKRFLPGK
jgi:hypothetical protein